MKNNRINAFIRILKKTGGGKGYGDEPGTTDINPNIQYYPVIWNDLNSIEMQLADATQARHYASVKVRRVPRLTANCKIEMDGDTFDIIGQPKNMGDNWWEIKVGRNVNG